MGGGGSEGADIPSWLKVMVAGAGFLSDAYDLFIINMVLPVLNKEYGGTAAEEDAVKVAALVGAVCGQLVFSVLADSIGRRVIFISTISCVVLGAALSTICFDHPNFSIYTQVALCQFVLGFGVGGEYPLSATVTSENSDAKSRGTRLGLVFGMQGVGNLVAALVAWALLSSPHLSLDAVWRIALGLGGVPGLLTVYWRYKMHETKAFERRADEEAGAHAEGAKTPTWRDALRSTGSVLWAHSGQLAGTALSWFIFDVTFYANGLSNAYVLESAGFGSQDELAQVARGTVIIASIALPGYILGILAIDRIGRRMLQIGGFVLVAVSFFAMGGGLRSLEKNGGLFIFVYGLTFLFSNFGPNLTTYVIPSELYPTQVRATCHGLSAASGKLGAVLGGATLKPLLESSGLDTVLYVCGAVAVLGALWSWAFTEDMSGLELSADGGEDDTKRQVAADNWRRAPVLDYIRATFFPSSDVAPKDPEFQALLGTDE